MNQRCFLCLPGLCERAAPLTLLNFLDAVGLRRALEAIRATRFDVVFLCAILSVYHFRSAEFPP